VQFEEGSAPFVRRHESARPDPSPRKKKLARDDKLHHYRRGKKVDAMHSG
jgi:hypothetical protein